MILQEGNPRSPTRIADVSRSGIESLRSMPMNLFVWEIFTEEGRLFKKGQFKNGKKEGYWIFYKRNGEPYARWTGFYKSGAKVGD